MPLTPTSLEPWATLHRPDAPAFIVALSHAGAGAAEVRRLRPRVGPAEVVPIVLPGREHRATEPVERDLDRLAARLHNGLAPLWHQPRPFVLVGVSMGAWVAFALARALRAAGAPSPQHLVLAARRAPHLPSVRPPIADLPQADFLRALQDRYGALPAALLGSDAMLAAFLPALRGDFALLDRARFGVEPPLAVPITTVRGTLDETVGEPEVRAWQSYTTAPFAHVELAAGHFVHRDAPDAFGAVVAEVIRPYCTPT